MLKTTVGSVTSIVNAVTLSVVARFPAGSVTIIVQLLCAPPVSALNVRVLLQTVAVVSADEQSPPYDMVPASSVVNV